MKTLRYYLKDVSIKNQNKQTQQKRHTMMILFRHPKSNQEVLIQMNLLEKKKRILFFESSPEIVSPKCTKKDSSLFLQEKRSLFSKEIQATFSKQPLKACSNLSESIEVIQKTTTQGSDSPCNSNDSKFSMLNINMNTNLQFPLAI
ncbi:unnamed protein product [Brachionus calyciflorus]|uniref:Uncharacterized protein n=1 Tax=Brachionus calyciflorus TaxID=104777 RepID=A0A814R8V3_9BILA|nr:unnamed protein product [Brachionus calyciflorus]